MDGLSPDVGAFGKTVDGTARGRPFNLSTDFPYYVYNLTGYRIVLIFVK
jgi:hypothetical protein